MCLYSGRWDPSPFIWPSSWRCGQRRQSPASRSPRTAGQGRPSQHSSWTGWRGPWKSSPEHRNTWSQKCLLNAEGGGRKGEPRVSQERNKTVAAVYGCIKKILSLIACWHLKKSEFLLVWQQIFISTIKHNSVNLWVTEAVQLFPLLGVGTPSAACLIPAVGSPKHRAGIYLCFFHHTHTHTAAWRALTAADGRKHGWMLNEWDALNCRGLNIWLLCCEITSWHT